jgi:hypothetical protein
MGFELRAYTLSHSTSPIFVKGFFKIKFHKLFYLGWLRTVILLISTSWVARIIGGPVPGLASVFKSDSQSIMNVAAMSICV